MKKKVEVEVEVDEVEGMVFLDHVAPRRRLSPQFAPLSPGRAWTLSEKQQQKSSSDNTVATREREQAVELA